VVEGSQRTKLPDVNEGEIYWWFDRSPGWRTRHIELEREIESLERKGTIISSDLKTKIVGTAVNISCHIARTQGELMSDLEILIANPNDQERLKKLDASFSEILSGVVNEDDRRSTLEDFLALVEMNFSRASRVMARLETMNLLSGLKAFGEDHLAWFKMVDEKLKDEDMRNEIIKTLGGSTDIFDLERRFWERVIDYSDDVLPETMKRSVVVGAN